jgi:hypothetical protein
MKKILGMNKNVFYLSLVSLFNDFSNEMIYSVMPAFSYGFCQLFWWCLERFNLAKILVWLFF